MYAVVGEDKRTQKKEVVSKHKNLAVCLKEIQKLTSIYGDRTRFIWRMTTSLEGNA